MAICCTEMKSISTWIQFYIFLCVFLWTCVYYWRYSYWLKIQLNMGDRHDRTFLRKHWPIRNWRLVRKSLTSSVAFWCLEIHSRWLQFSSHLHHSDFTNLGHNKSWLSSYESGIRTSILQLALTIKTSIEYKGAVCDSNKTCGISAASFTEIRMSPKCTGVLP